MSKNSNKVSQILLIVTIHLGNEWRKSQNGTPIVRPVRNAYSSLVKWSVNPFQTTCNSADITAGYGGNFSITTRSHETSGTECHLTYIVFLISTKAEQFPVGLNCRNFENNSEINGPLENEIIRRQKLTFLHLNPVSITGSSLISEFETRRERANRVSHVWVETLIS